MNYPAIVGALPQSWLQAWCCTPRPEQKILVLEYRSRLVPERESQWVLNYERTSFDGGAAGGAVREDEQAILTRVGVEF